MSSTDSFNRYTLPLLLRLTAVASWLRRRMYIATSICGIRRMPNAYHHVHMLLLLLWLYHSILRLLISKK